MDAHLSRVVRAMGGMISLFPFLYQLYALENVAVLQHQTRESSSCSLQFIHLIAIQELAAGVYRRPVTNTY
jgi:hypothetical protein